MKKQPPAGVKTLVVEIKAAGDQDGLAKGQFTGYASVFGNKDSHGDVVVAGAFAESLATYGANGAGVPAYWSHRMDDPMMNIGQTVEAKEDEHGLFVKVQLDLDNPNGAYAHKLIKEGRVAQMSFAYSVKDWAFVEAEDDYFWELRKLDLHEVSVVPIGANQETELLAVKQMITAVKADASLSAGLKERLAQASALIADVLDEVEESDEKEVSDEEPKSGKPEDPETGKGEDQVEAKAHDGDPDAALAIIALARVGVATTIGEESHHG